MKEKKRLRLKKFYLHPITTFLLLILVIIVLSGILSIFEMQGAYNTVNTNTLELKETTVAIFNLFSYAGVKFIISNAMTNFISFAPLGMLLISLIGINIAEATGFLEALAKRKIAKMPKYTLTFLVLLIATISSLVNDIGYSVLIPLAALIYFINGRNPIIGIVTAFCGTAFGYGVSVFVGSMDVALIPYTKSAAMLIDKTTHIPLTSNLFFLIVSSFVISIVGTFIIEKIVVPMVGKYKKDEEFAETEKYHVIDLEEEEQKRIEQEKREKDGLRIAGIIAIIVVLAFAYMIIPHLPGSGMLLDLSENSYVDQLFGSKSYFQDGFTYMVSLLIILTGIGYGIGAKTIKSDKDLIEASGKNFAKVGSLFILIFVAAQFIAIYKKTNFGIIISCWLADLLNNLNFSGIPLIIVTLIAISIANIFLTSPSTKWMIFSPIVVPLFMKSNYSAPFAQLVMRVGNSMTNGYTIFLAAFVIYIGYLNIYNLNTDKPFTIRKALQLVTPYFLIISLVWILLTLGWSIIGLPIGPNVFPTI